MGLALRRKGGWPGVGMEKLEWMYAFVLAPCILASAPDIGVLTKVTI